MFTHDTIKLASSSGEELQIKGAFDIWVKLSEADKYKRKIKVLVCQSCPGRQQGRKGSQLDSSTTPGSSSKP